MKNKTLNAHAAGEQKKSSVPALEKIRAASSPEAQARFTKWAAKYKTEGGTPGRIRKIIAAYFKDNNILSLDDVTHPGVACADLIARIKTGDPLGDAAKPLGASTQNIYIGFIKRFFQEVYEIKIDAAPRSLKPKEPQRLAKGKIAAASVSESREETAPFSSVEEAFADAAQEQMGETLAPSEDEEVEATAPSLPDEGGDDALDTEEEDIVSDIDIEPEDEPVDEPPPYAAPPAGGAAKNAKFVPAPARKAGRHSDSFSGYRFGQGRGVKPDDDTADRPKPVDNKVEIFGKAPPPVVAPRPAYSPKTREICAGFPAEVEKRKGTPRAVDEAIHAIGEKLILDGHVPLSKSSHAEIKEMLKKVLSSNPEAEALFSEAARAMAGSVAAAEAEPAANERERVSAPYAIGEVFVAELRKTDFKGVSAENTEAGAIKDAIARTSQLLKINEGVVTGKLVHEGVLTEKGNRFTYGFKEKFQALRDAEPREEGAACETPDSPVSGLPVKGWTPRTGP